MPPLLCPLCSVSLPPSSLEAHLRRELAYAPLACLLCRRRFLGADAARKHFHGPLAEHPGSEPALLEDRDEAVERRLAELLRKADISTGPGCGACDCCAQWRGQIGTSEAHKDSQEPSWKAPAAHQMPEAPQRMQEPVRHEPAPQHVDQQHVRQPLTFEMPAPAVEVKLSQVKAEAAEGSESEVERKPVVATDGKVSCLLCGLRLGKNDFRLHALGAHSRLQPFSCSLCDYKRPRKSELLKHVSKSHPDQAYEDVVTELDLRAEAERLLESCFGSSKDTSYASLHCSLCDKAVPKTNAKDHVASVHLKKTVRACRLCPFASTAFFATNMKNHLKKGHGVHLTPETCSDDSAKLLPAIKRLMADLFVTHQ